jgi:hypothetical protein
MLTRIAENRHAGWGATRLTFASIFCIAQALEKPPARLLCKILNCAHTSDALVRACRDADVIRTDHERALGGLIRQAPEGKQDPRQKKERGEGQQNKN